MNKIILTKDEVLRAQKHTKSNRAAARYLNISYGHCLKFFKMYTDKETGKTFLELHKNQAGKGIPKFLKSKGKEPSLIDIIELGFRMPKQKYFLGPFAYTTDIFLNKIKLPTGLHMLL